MKINILNTDKLIEALDTVQKGCTARTAEIHMIISAVEAGIKKLTELGIPKQHQTDSMVILHPPTVPNSYKYPAEGTRAVIKRFPSGWFVTSIARVYTGSNPGGSGWKVTLTLSDRARAAIPQVYNL